MADILTLCLHRVVPDTQVEENWPWLERGSALTASALREILSALCLSYTPCTEEAVVAALQSGVTTSKERLLWVTFDDGYRDNLQVAAPVLEEFGVRPSLFLTAGVLSPRFRLPVDRWYDIALRAQGPVRSIDLGDGEFEVDPASSQFRQRMVDGPEKRRFVRSTHREQEALLQRLALALGVPVRRRAGADRPAIADYLQQENVAELAARGWRIGGHGRSHRLLAGMNSSQLAKELCTEDVTRLVPAASRSRFFAWPDGAFDSRVIAAAEQHLEPHGIVGGLSIDPERPFDVGNRWALPRVLAPSLKFVNEILASIRGEAP